MPTSLWAEDIEHVIAGHLLDGENRSALDEDDSRTRELTPYRHQAILPRKRSELLSWALNSPDRRIDELMHQIEELFVL